MSESSKERGMIRRKWRSRVARAYARELRIDHQCPDCGIVWPWFVYDFHHRPGTIKLYSIYRLLANKNSIQKLIDEIQKCDIICASCHRVRHTKDLTNACKT